MAARTLRTSGKYSWMPKAAKQAVINSGQSSEDVPELNPSGALTPQIPWRSRFLATAMWK